MRPELNAKKEETLMVIICLNTDQWKRLEPHLPKGVSPQLTDDAGPFPMLDCRQIPDENTYEKVLDIAKTHCPELVQDIEKHKRISDAHQ
jgi:hypothetical protein